jgi:uncharacterized protein (UPF0332 family)
MMVGCFAYRVRGDGTHRPVRDGEVVLQEMNEGFGHWNKRAGSALLEAEGLLSRSLARESISMSYEAMICAAMAALETCDKKASKKEDVVRLFQSEALPILGLSKENQRALVIVADLYHRVVDCGEMEADPVTASACLSDARSFIGEIAQKTPPRGEGEGR